MSGICQAYPDRVEVRGRDLCGDLMGRMGFTEYFHLLLQITGASAAAVIDANTGMMLGQGGGGVNLDVAAAGNTRVVMAKMETMKHLGIKGKIEDILITLTDQFHIIRLIAKKPGLFIYLVLDKVTGDLAQARASATLIEAELTM